MFFFFFTFIISVKKSVRVGLPVLPSEGTATTYAEVFNKDAQASTLKIDHTLYNLELGEKSENDQPAVETTCPKNDQNTECTSYLVGYRKLQVNEITTNEVTFILTGTDPVIIFFDKVCSKITLKGPIIAHFNKVDEKFLLALTLSVGNPNPFYYLPDTDNVEFQFDYIVEYLTTSYDQALGFSLYERNQGKDLKYTQKLTILESVINPSENYTYNLGYGAGDFMGVRALAIHDGEFPEIMSCYPYGDVHLYNPETLTFDSKIRIVSFTDTEKTDGDFDDPAEKPVLPGRDVTEKEVGMSTGQIVGLGVGLILGVVIIVVVVLIILRKRKQDAQSFGEVNDGMNVY